MPIRKARENYHALDRLTSVERRVRQRRGGTSAGRRNTRADQRVSLHGFLKAVDILPIVRACASLLILCVPSSATAAPDEATSARPTGRDDPGVSRRQDDPGLDRRLRPRAPPAALAAAPVESAPSPPPDGIVHVGLAFGLASPLADPRVREGYGGAIALAIGRRLGFESRASFAWQEYEPPLDNLGLAFVAGDVTAGPYLAIRPPRPGQTLSVFTSAGFGPYWMTGLRGVTWSLGVHAGAGIEWRLGRYAGLRLEARYHLFHLKEIAGPTYYDRNSFQTLGAIDRFELPLALAIHL